MIVGLMMVIGGTLVEEVDEVKGCGIIGGVAEEIGGCKVGHFGCGGGGGFLPGMR